MASSAIALEEGKQNLLALGWIINKRDDLIWFIGSVVTSYAFLAANLMLVKLGLSVMIMTWIWALGFDGPHVFGTVSRTYADSEERHKRARLYYGTLLLFLLGPAFVLAGRARLLGTEVWSPAFFFFASLWAYYHLVKQHYGFMVLYKKKNADLAKIDNALDRLFLLFAFNYPFVEFIARDPEAMARVPAALRGGVDGLSTILLIATVVLGFAWLARQVQRALVGEPLNVPKYLLLAAAIPMHWIVLLTPSAHKPIAIVAILTIYHNLQYHR